MFNPVRLKVARERRELTKKALAEKAGVSQLTLTRLEKGVTTEPERATVMALAGALGFPMDFFYLDDCEQVESTAVSFRSLSAMTSKQMGAALAAGSIALQINDWLEARFNLPQPDLPDLRGENPEAAAGALRSHWGIGSKPISHLLKLLEAKGVRVFYLSERNKNVDAFSYWRGGVPLVFLNTFKSAERSRFDAAHELGHLVMHMHGSTGGREAEREADRFAGAFLMPRDDLVGNIRRHPQLADLIEAKSRWGVSVSALVRNVYEAELMSDWHYRDLCKAMSAAGYRSREPRPMPREESILWRKVFESLWRDRVTKAHVAKDLALPSDVLDALVGGQCVGPAEGRPALRERPALRVI